MAAGRWVVSTLLVPALAGCAVGGAGDAATLAVRDAHAAVASAVLATGLQRDGRATAPYTAVVVGDALVAVAEARQELALAGGVLPDRRELADAALDPAVAELAGIADAAAVATSGEELSRLAELERRLAATSAALGG
ncbi:MAG: hypothetical protein AAGC63_04055 [Propionicimonas sp.]|nr:hypothetical protein [Propionicimonas sp.]